MEILRLLAILLLIILLIAIGSSVIYKDNFAVVTGTVSLTEAPEPLTSYTQTTFNVNYPTGFNQENCIAIAFDVKRDAENQSYVYGYAPPTLAAVSLNQSFPRTILFNASNINCAIYNSSTARTVAYRIVLMKI